MATNDRSNPSPDRPAGGKVHPAAAVGFQRGVDAYRAARPGYHTDTLDRLVDLVDGRRVLEIGAGTGALTGPLVERGLDVTAVEPVEAMRAALAEALPGLDVRSGTAESLPVEAGGFGVVVVAQAFHWFDHRPALDEIDRVLGSGGHLATVWNVKDGDEPWYRCYMAVIDRHADQTPRYADMAWRRAIDADPRYELAGEWTVDNSRLADVDDVVGRALSTSFIAALDDDRRAVVVEEIRAALGGVDLPVRFPYRGEVQAWANRA